MALRVPGQLVAAGIALGAFSFGAPAGAATAPSVLVSYSFDDEVATGPDTFAIWQGARHSKTGKGRVSLNTAFHLSGYRSVELRDVAGDGDFPELQGYFPSRRDGRLYFHFAFLTTDPKEELNIALAGPRSFQMVKDGFALWLATRDGQLVHISDSIPKKLFPVEAFAWYAVDVAYDVAAGTYALTVFREGQPRPLVSLRDQPNAAKQPGSAVDKFSFVGSPYADRSNVVYYVDDVAIGTDESVNAIPFVAPGRRKLFVDRFLEYRRLLQERPRCLPASAPEDVGLTSDDLADLAREGLLYAAKALLAGEKVDFPRFTERGGPGHARQVLQAVADWNAGCEALEADDPARALPRFEKAAAAVPEGGIFTLSAALALTGLKRFAEADDRLLAFADRSDPRFAVASAYVGIGRGDLDRAEAWLRDPASRVLDRNANPFLRLFRNGFDTDALRTLRAQLGGEFRERLEETLVAEQYFYVQLWKSRYDLARDYALRMAERLRRGELPTSVWAERAGDASFLGQDLREAGELYREAVGGEKDHGALMALYLKLADVAYLSGDLVTERELREHYYGALTE